MRNWMRRRAATMPANWVTGTRALPESKSNDGLPFISDTAASNSYCLLASTKMPRPISSRWYSPSCMLAPSAKRSVMSREYSMRPIGALSMAPPPTLKRESGVDSAKESRPSDRVPSPTGTVRFAFDAPMRVSDAAAIMGLPRASRRACSARADSCRNEAKARSSSRLSPACGAGKSGNPAALAGVGEAKAAASASSSARMP